MAAFKQDQNNDGQDRRDASVAVWKLKKDQFFGERYLTICHRRWQRVFAHPMTGEKNRAVHTFSPRPRRALQGDRRRAV